MVKYIHNILRSKTVLNKIIYDFANFLRKVGYDFNELSHEKIINMKKEIANYGNKIEFKIEQFSDGTWSAVSTNIDGIITGGSNIKNMSAEMKDAIFTYFEIPPHLCNDTILKAENEPIKIMQRVYV